MQFSDYNNTCEDPPICATFLISGAAPGVELFVSIFVILKSDLGAGTTSRLAAAALMSSIVVCTVSPR